MPSVAIVRPGATPASGPASTCRFLEFNARGVNKGAGLLRLARELGVDPADTIAIGDNWNDWPMLRDAGLGPASPTPWRT